MFLNVDLFFIKLRKGEKAEIVFKSYLWVSKTTFSTINFFSKTFFQNSWKEKFDSNYKVLLWTKWSAVNIFIRGCATVKMWTLYCFVLLCAAVNSVFNKYAMGRMVCTQPFWIEVVHLTNKTLFQRIVCHSFTVYDQQLVR